jgi:hypothetical protein
MHALDPTLGAVHMQTATLLTIQLCLFESLARALCALSGAARSLIDLLSGGAWGPKLGGASAGIVLTKFCEKFLDPRRAL